MLSHKLVSLLRFKQYWCTYWIILYTHELTVTVPYCCMYLHAQLTACQKELEEVKTQSKKVAGLFNRTRIREKNLIQAKLEVEEKLKTAEAMNNTNDDLFGQPMTSSTSTGNFPLQSINQ